jgi:hypothetical protein
VSLHDDIIFEHWLVLITNDLLVVEENLKVVETQLNETNARAGAAPGVFKAEQYGVSRNSIFHSDDEQSNIPIL